MSRISPAGALNERRPRRPSSRFNSQIIISNPARADNTRQTIIQPDLPDIRLNADVRMPNIVMWSRQPLPAQLAYLPAPELHVQSTPKLPLPSDVAHPLPPVDLVKREVARLKAPRLAMAAIEPPPPDIPRFENRMPRLNARALSRRTAIEPPAPEMPNVQSNTAIPSALARSPQVVPPTPSELAPSSQIATGRTPSLGRLIALSPNPAPATGGVALPGGNRSADFTVGEPDRVADAASAATREIAAIRIPGISISGGVRPPSPAMGPVVSAPTEPPPPRPAAPPHSKRDRTELASLIARSTRSPAAFPEWGRRGDIRDDSFSPGKRVYTVYINMPNLSSHSGSWILRFAEFGNAPPNGSGDDITAPVALRKVDPGYDSTSIREKIQGTVTLYAVIQSDGKVKSVRIVRGLAPDLDERAINALTRWEFQPATRSGRPVDLEALVQIPFVLNGSLR